MRPTRVILLVALLAAVACSDEVDGPDTPAPPPDDGVVDLAYDFEDGSEGWASEITGYTDATRPQDAVSETGVAPPGLDAGTGFFHLAADNPSDDVFHYLLREVTLDAEPGSERTYDATFSVTFASDAPTGCAGIGGAPGEAVYLKVGATADQPIPVMEDGDSRLSVDKGGQSQGGTAATVAGTIDNGIPCEQALESDPPPYAMVTRTGTVEDVEISDDGSVWLFVGTDSGFEGRTSIYYDRIEVTLTPATADDPGDDTGDAIDDDDAGTDDGTDDTGDQSDVGALAFTDCEADRYTVGYPEGWNTNDTDGLLGPCEVFHPGEIEVPEQPRDRDLDHAVSMYVDEVDVDDLDPRDDPNEILDERTTTVDGRSAVVIESRSTGQGLLPEGERSTTWTIDLDGDILVATTSTLGDTDYERDQRILERMVTEELAITEAVQDVLWEGDQDVFIGLDAERPYRLERLTDPQRIVVDIEAA